MSFEALAWASKCSPGTPAKKLVLLALAECASREDAETYPSIAAIEEFSSLNRKTIITALDSLEADGFIEDTGGKKGKTGQVKVYRLTFKTVPKKEQSQKRNSSTFSVKQSQKRDTEPVKEPVIKKHTARMMPTDWKPVAFAKGSKCHSIIADWPDGEYETQVEHFTAHHRGKGNRFVDWQDAWKTWVLNSRKWGAPKQAYRNAPQPASSSDPMVAAILAKRKATA